MQEKYIQLTLVEAWPYALSRTFPVTANLFPKSVCISYCLLAHYCASLHLYYALILLISLRPKDGPT